MVDHPDREPEGAPLHLLQELGVDPIRAVVGHAR